jgi:Pvc16 N-terminal domain
VRELSRYPVLDPGLLSASGGFAPADRLQFVPAELSLDDTAKLWQLLNTQYRPSLTYVVRNVAIGPETAPQFAPVVATRAEYRDDVRALAAEGL